jgi:hypothetical protein
LGIRGQRHWRVLSWHFPVTNNSGINTWSQLIIYVGWVNELVNEEFEENEMPK